MAQHTEFLGEMDTRLKNNLTDAITQVVNAYETDAPPPTENEDAETNITLAFVVSSLN